MSTILGKKPLPALPTVPTAKPNEAPAAQDAATSAVGSDIEGAAAYVSFAGESAYERRSPSGKPELNPPSAGEGEMPTTEGMADEPVRREVTPSIAMATRYLPASLAPAPSDDAALARVFPQIASGAKSASAAKKTIDASLSDVTALHLTSHPKWFLSDVDVTLKGKKPNAWYTLLAVRVPDFAAIPWQEVAKAAGVVKGSGAAHELTAEPWPDEIHKRLDALLAGRGDPKALALDLRGKYAQADPNGDLKVNVGMSTNKELLLVYESRGLPWKQNQPQAP